MYWKELDKTMHLINYAGLRESSHPRTSAQGEVPAASTGGTACGGVTHSHPSGSVSLWLAWSQQIHVPESPELQ